MAWIPSVFLTSLYFAIALPVTNVNTYYFLKTYYALGPLHELTLMLSKFLR